MSRHVDSLPAGARRFPKGARGKPRVLARTAALAGMLVLGACDYNAAGPAAGILGPGLAASTGGNRPPTAHAGPDQTVACTSDLSAVVQLDGSRSTDPDGEPLGKYEWFDGNGTILARGPTPTVTLGLGEHPLTLRVWDQAHSYWGDDVANIEVVDRTPPTLSVTHPVPHVLWPPNGANVDIGGLVAVASDECDPSVIIEASVVSSEPDNGSGDGGTLGDIRVWKGAGRLLDSGHNGNTRSWFEPGGVRTDDLLFSTNAHPTVWFEPAHHQLLLRAERSAPGPGRVYTITVFARDERNQTSRTLTVTVPRHRPK